MDVTGCNTFWNVTIGQWVSVSYHKLSSSVYAFFSSFFWGLICVYAICLCICLCIVSLIILQLRKAGYEGLSRFNHLSQGYSYWHILTIVYDIDKGVDDIDKGVDE